MKRLACCIPQTTIWPSAATCCSGSALGLAHTMRQTVIFRTDTISQKVRNLYFVGAGTNPGIGLPTYLIPAELVYKCLIGDKSAGPLTSLARPDRAA